MWIFKPNVKKMEKKRDVKGLIKALNNRDYDVRREAAEALGRIGDKRAVEPLIQALKERGDLSAYAAEALGNIEAAGVVAPLIQAIKVKSSLFFQKKAFKALAHLGRPREWSRRKVVKPIFHELKEGARELLQELENKTKEINELIDEEKKRNKPFPNREMREYERYKKKIFEILYTLGIHTVTPLIQVLMDENSRIKHVAAEALGNLKDKRAVEPLIKVLKDKRGYVRSFVATALGELGDKRAIEPLLEVLKKKRGGASSAVTALGMLGDKRAVDPLIKVLKDKRGARLVAVTALGKLGDKRAIDPILQFLFETPRNTSLLEQSVFPIIKKALLELTPPPHTLPITDIITASGYYHDYNLYHPIIEYSDKAIGRLCRQKSPITSNLLHLIAQKKDLSIWVQADEYGRSEEYKLNFQHQRDMAREELERRGDPPYQPKAYLS